MFDGCPRCKSTERVKSGMAHGMQRWLCKSCGCNYTKSTPRGYQDELERQAISHYLSGISLRKIETIMGISNVTVLRWVRDFKNQFLAPFKHVTAADIQMRCQSVEAAQNILATSPQNPHHRWVLMEMAVEDMPAEGVVVIQPNTKPYTVPAAEEVRAKNS